MQPHIHKKKQQSEPSFPTLTICRLLSYRLPQPIFARARGDPCGFPFAVQLVDILREANPPCGDLVQTWVRVVLRDQTARLFQQQIWGLQWGLVGGWVGFGCYGGCAEERQVGWEGIVVTPVQSNRGLQSGARWKRRRSLFRNGWDLRVRVETFRQELGVGGF